jgi:hypothetical protein
MVVLPEDYLDRVLAPKAIDPRRVALILKTLYPNCTLQELEALLVQWAAKDGYSCVWQAPFFTEGDPN